MIRNTVAEYSDFDIPSIEWRPVLESPVDRYLWGATILLFVAGDAATTILGLRVGAVEANPFPAFLLELSSSLAGALLIILGWKAVVLVGFIGMYRLVPRPHRLGIPIGLTLLGAFAVVWNLVVIAHLLG